MKSKNTKYGWYSIFLIDKPFIYVFKELIADYKDFRGIAAAFIAGCRLMIENK